MTDMVSDSAIWGFIGTLVGASASIATTWLSARSSSKLQEEKARTERQEYFNAFQRETLLELQETIHDAMRLANRAYIEDCESFHAGTAWHHARLSNELDESIRLTMRKVVILRERVADDSVRQKVKALMKITSLAILAKSEQETRSHLEQLNIEADQVFEVLGSTLRACY